FSMYCNFFNNSERNLVVAGTSQLYVYRLNRDAEVGRPAPAAAPRGEGCPVETEAGQTGPVVGCVQSLFSSLPRSSTSSHSWRARRPALRVLLLHRLEALQDMTVVVSTSVPTKNDRSAGEQRSSFLPSYIIDVRALDEKLLNIVDLQFLHGYYEPTLLILFEPNQTWPGYVLTLITDGMRSVRAFHFDKAAASVLTTSMVTMEPGYLFLGSRLGNSLLLKYTEKLQEPPAGTAREVADKVGGKSAPQDEVDEIEVYGSEAQSGTQLATYSFEVCDSILNIGPCANAAMGEPAFLSEEVPGRGRGGGGQVAQQGGAVLTPLPPMQFQNSVWGAGVAPPGGARVRLLIPLVSFQKSIRPQVVTTFELPGCYDMWTVIAPVRKEQEETTKGEGAEQEPSAPEADDDGRRHGFLILSREDSTMGEARKEEATRQGELPLVKEVLLVFICGPSPHWLLVTGRGALRLHPMGIDGPIDSFAPFHNVNCPRGFLYFNRQGELRISVLPAYLSYDAPWPVRKIPLRCTAHYVAYHVESKV
ncbi:hypothetical protein E2I00_012072, partial [Balaenoptera physalus]